MNTVILINEEEILGIVARHLAQHNSTSMRATRWLNGERSIIAAVLTNRERKNRRHKPTIEMGLQEIAVCEGGQSKTMKVLGTAPSAGKAKTKKGEKS